MLRFIIDGERTLGKSGAKSKFYTTLDAECKTLESRLKEMNWSDRQNECSARVIGVSFIPDGATETIEFLREENTRLNQKIESMTAELDEYLELKEPKGKE